MADMAGVMALQHMNNLPEHRRAEFQMAYQARKKDRTTALVLSLFLGWFAIDRFYLGQAGLGLLKLFTCGGGGIWWFVDWFVIMGAADQKNIETLTQLQLAYPSALVAGHYAPQLHGYYQPPPGYGPPPQA